MIRNIFISGSMGYDEIMDFPGHFKDYFHPEKLHQINVSFAVARLNKHVGGIATNIAYAIANTIPHMSFRAKSRNLGNEISPRVLRIGGLGRDDKVQIYPVGAVGKDPSTSSGQVAIYPVGAIGRDGQDILNFFKQHKIATDYIQIIDDLYTTTGKVITDMNDNQIWGYYYGASAKFAPKFKFQISNLKSNDTNFKIQNKANDQRLTTNDFWILSATHEKPFSALLRHCIANKLPYLFDPGMTLTWIRDDLLKKGVMNATYVVGNDYEMAMIEKRLNMKVEDMVKKGVNVITTLGEKGVAYRGSVILNSIQDLKGVRDDRHPQSFRAKQSGVEKSLLVSPFKVKKVVDPTGAGDAWRGGFVAGLAQGLPIEECLKLGNVMGSMAVEQVGTVTYTATKEEIAKRMGKVKVVIK